MTPASIWIEADNFMIRFPDRHTVSVPIASPQVLVNILRARERSASQPTVGTEGAPVQYDIDAIARALAATTEHARRGEAVARREARILSERKALANRVKRRLDREEADRFFRELGL